MVEIKIITKVKNWVGPPRLIDTTNPLNNQRTVKVKC